LKTHLKLSRQVLFKRIFGDAGPWPYILKKGDMNLDIAG
jgi:hypothetical protein